MKTYEELNDDIPICGCGQPWLIQEKLYDYLSTIWGRYNEGVTYEETEAKIEALFETRLERSLIEYLADAAGFTEHGGNVHGQWVDTNGEHWMRGFEMETHPE